MIWQTALLPAEVTSEAEHVILFFLVNKPLAILVSLSNFFSKLESMIEFSLLLVKVSFTLWLCVKAFKHREQLWKQKPEVHFN